MPKDNDPGTTAPDGKMIPPSGFGDTNAQKVSDDGMVKMVKDGDAIRVHPSTVKSHQEVGWRAA